MKIALVHYSAPPVIGGVERIVGEQVAILRRAGHLVTLCCFEGGEAVQTDRLVRLSRAWSSTQLESVLLEALGSSEVVFLHNVGTMPFHLPLTAALRSAAAQTPGIRWLCWVHDLACGNPDYPPGLSEDWRPLMEEASPSWAYIAISHNRAEEVQRRLGVKCNTIPNGICLKTTLGLPEELSEFAETSGCWDADYVLFHPCRLVRRKKIETGIRVVKALTEFGRSTRYLITAAVDPHRPESAAYFEELKSLVRSLGVEREVHFLWEHFPISSEVLRGLYAVSDGLFFPGLQEGFGLPLLEATASRLPAFCPNGEPMNQLPGAVCWPSSWTPERIAHWLIRQIETRHPIQARKNLVRSYRWASIYRNFLAPLFHQPQHRNP